MSTIITGNAAAIRQPDRVEYSPQTGRQVWAVWQSADESAITTAREAYETSGQTCRSFGDGAVFTVEVLQGGGSDETNYALQDNWAIVANELVRGDRQSNEWLALSDADREDVLSKLEANTKPTATGFTTSSTKYFFYKRAYYGSDNYAVSQYVLRHTTIASPSYQANAADFGVEKLYSFGQLIDEITNASLWVNPCPPRLIAKIESIPEPADLAANDASFYLWSWRKLASTEETTPDGRIQITTEYWLGMWPLPHYGLL